MTELHALLDAAASRPDELDVAADIRRGRRALSRRRHRSLARGALGVAMVTAAAVGGTQLPDHAADPAPPAGRTPHRCPATH
jgi:hypothetical protein